MNRPTFSPADEAEIRARRRAGAQVECPHCRVPLAVEAVPPPDGVAYVRRRSWLTCPSCRRTMVADDPREGA